MDEDTLRRRRKPCYIRVANGQLEYAFDGDESLSSLLTSFPLVAGFRDPYLFPSARLASLLAPAANSTTPSSDLFATVSGGVHGEGAKLFLYRQVTEGNVIDWDYIGPILETGLNQSWSEWSGSECFPHRLVSFLLTVTQTSASTCASHVA